MLRPMLRRVLVGACLLALLPAATALGHAELTEARPGPDEVVAVVPAELVARFSQDLKADRTSIELRHPSGQTIATGGKDPDRARVQLMVLPPLAPGEYEVRWVSFSAEDDELARGRYRFTVTEPPPGPSAIPCPSASPGASPAASPIPIVTPVPAASASPMASPLPSPGSSLLPLDPCASPAPVLEGSPVPDASVSPAP